MKILRIQLRNLASLAGTQPALCFSSAAESSHHIFEDGLVAITGVTGSGKSTILDALCLALFGKTPRTATASNGDNDGADVSSIMTRNSNDCFAEVDFTGNDEQVFRAKWQIHRARTGKLQKAKHSLYHVQADGSSGTCISEKTSDVRKLVQQAIGMGFDQFVGVVVLAQGSFSSFLRGDKDTRSTLLERLTKTGVYQHLSIAAHKDAAHKQQACDKLSQQLADRQPLNDDQRDELTQQLRVCQQAHTAAEKQRTHYQQRVHSLTHYITVTNNLQQSIATLQEAEQRFTAAEPQRQEFTQAQLAAELEPARHNCEQRQKDLSQTESALHAHAQDLKEAENSWQQHAENLRQHARSFAGIVDRLESEEQALQHAKAADPARIVAITNALTQADEQTQTIARLQTDIKKITAEYEQSSRTYANKQKELARLQAACDEHEKQLHAIHAERDAHTQRYASGDQLTEWHHHLQRFIDITQESEQLQAQTQQLTSSLSQAQAALEQAQQHTKAQQTLCANGEHTLSLSEEHLRQAETHAAIHEFRHVLIPGEACPLCNHTVEHIPTSNTDNPIIQAQKQVEECRTSVQQLRSALQASEQKVQAAQQSLITAQSAQQNHQQLISTNTQALNQQQHILQPLFSVFESSSPLLVREALQSARDKINSFDQQYKQCEQAYLPLRTERDTCQRNLESSLATQTRLETTLEQTHQQQQHTQEALKKQQSLIQQQIAELATACDCASPDNNANTQRLWLEQRTQAYRNWKELSDMRQHITAKSAEFMEQLPSQFPAGWDWSPLPPTEFNAHSGSQAWQHVRQTGQEWKNLMNT